jgi:hypothetical protein
MDRNSHMKGIFSMRMYSFHDGHIHRTKSDLSKLVHDDRRHFLLVLLLFEIFHNYHS